VTVTSNEQPASLAALASVVRLAKDMSGEVPGLVGQARRDGCTWAAIGAALGITRQAAYARFGRYLSEVDEDAEAQ
jgi:hypothetical protein